MFESEEGAKTKDIKPMIHPCVDPPICESCQKLELSFFDPGCPGCYDNLINPNTTVPEILAILRQWTPQIQQNLELLINEILKRNAHVNDRDASTDMTLLQYACKSGTAGIGDPQNAAEVVTKLISKGADVSIRCGRTNMTALHYAAYFNVVPVIEVLLKTTKASDIDSTCSEFDHGSSLHIAASNLAYEAVKVLLQNGANPMMKDEKGRGPSEWIPDPTNLDCDHAMTDLVVKLKNALQPNPTTAEHETGIQTQYRPAESASNEMDEARDVTMMPQIGTVPSVRSPIFYNYGPQEQSQMVYGIPHPGNSQFQAMSGTMRPWMMGATPNPGDQQFRMVAGMPYQGMPPSQVGHMIHQRMPPSQKVTGGMSCQGMPPSHEAGGILYQRMSHSHVMGHMIHQEMPHTHVAGDMPHPGGFDSQSDPSLGGHPHKRLKLSTTSHIPETERHVRDVTMSSDYGNIPVYTSSSGSSWWQGNPMEPEEAKLTGLKCRTSSITDLAEFDLGDRVTVAGQRNGTVRFLGETKFAPGIWYGIELDCPVGKNNGSVNNFRYFHCQPKHGVFVPPSRIQKYKSGLSPARPSESNVSFILELGMAVSCDGEQGIVKYIGPTDFSEGIWVGVELQRAEGKNDGCVQDKRYFSCKPDHGLLVRPSKITVCGINGSKVVSDYYYAQGSQS